MNVRVGIVSYRTREHLGRCLAALPEALGRYTADTVVVDNASADASPDLARAMGAAVVVNSRNLGYARAMNQALHGRCRCRAGEDGSGADVFEGFAPHDRRQEIDLGDRRGSRVAPSGANGRVMSYCAPESVQVRPVRAGADLDGAVGQPVTVTTIGFHGVLTRLQLATEIYGRPLLLNADVGSRQALGFEVGRTVDVLVDTADVSCFPLSKPES